MHVGSLGQVHQFVWQGGCYSLDDVAERFHGARLQLGHCDSRGAALLQCSVHLQPAFPSRCHVPGMFHQQLKTRQERAAALHCKHRVV